MKYASVAALCFILLACRGNTQEKTQLKSQQDSVSYTIGLSIGKNFKAQKLDVNPDIVARGIKDVIDSLKPALTDEQAQTIMMDLQKRMMAKQEESMKVQGDKNKKESETFLEENKKKQGVVVLPSGLQYKVITMGKGPKPTADQTVSLNYRGTLIDGTEFDNSYKTGKPATYPVKNFIPGWIEALQLMPVGSKWELYVPPALAYGDRGAGQAVPPNAALIFELELVGISK
jgi:FKBP-type peptidyl-prolyl cis-trans isomerase FklB